MRQLILALCCAIVALAAVAFAQPAAAQAPNENTKGKNCRMEQQCHWENFKKICVWVQVCR
jgi:hypothetical protein